MFIYKYIYTNIEGGCYFIGGLDENFKKKKNLKWNIQIGK